MNQNILNLIFITLIIYLIYNNSKKKKKMSNTDIKKIIHEEYKIDVDAIRNLSKLANELTLNNKLIIPGGLEIQGKISCNSLAANKSIYAATTIQAEKGLYGKDLTIHNSGSVGGKTILTFNQPVRIKSGANGHFSGKYFHTHNDTIIKATAPIYKTQYTFEK